MKNNNGVRPIDAETLKYKINVRQLNVEKTFGHYGSNVETSLLNKLFQKVYEMIDEMPTVHFCRSCGRLVENPIEHCPYCGEKLLKE